MLKDTESLPGKVGIFGIEKDVFASLLSFVHHFTYNPIQHRKSKDNQRVGGRLSTR